VLARHARIVLVSELERRRARGLWEVRKFRDDQAEEAADYDALFWDRIPVAERAEAVFQLSMEAFSLAGGDPSGPRLPRSALHLERR
jgi:hypothetical protein